jgi:hypothetical protein
MIWIILALLILAFGIALDIYLKLQKGESKKEELVPTGVCLGIGIVSISIMVVLNTFTFSNGVSAIAKLGERIPHLQNHIIEFEEKTQKEPTNLAELLIYQDDLEQLEEYHNSLECAEKNLEGRIAKQENRSPWTNIFVLFNGRYKY